MCIFVALRGGINTGKSSSSAEYGTRDVFGTFTGYFLNKVGGYDGKLTLIYEQSWIPITPQARELETKLPQILINGVQEMKELAEKQ
jgi:hypothetical protein